MAKQTIALGTAPTGVGGDTPRSAFTKTNANFDEIYSLFYQKSTILGTVSQASGTPTGAIIENATNANGTYTKFADGTMIMHGTMPDYAVAANAIATVSSAATFPALFASTGYYIEFNGSPSTTNDIYGYTRVNSRTTNNATGIFRNGPTAQTITGNRYFAIGRWY